LVQGPSSAAQQGQSSAAGNAPAPAAAGVQRQHKREREQPGLPKNYVANMLGAISALHQHEKCADVLVVGVHAVSFSLATQLPAAMTPIAVLIGVAGWHRFEVKHVSGGGRRSPPRGGVDPSGENQQLLVDETVVEEGPTMSGAAIGTFQQNDKCHTCLCVPGHNAGRQGTTECLK
jgi:hypothetical protein